MKLKIADNLESLTVFPGVRIKREEVRKMVYDYREENKTETKLFYAHFSLSEILELFADNNVLPEDMIKSLQTQTTQNFIKDYGFKIYLGKYGNTASAPADETYKGCITTIVCNTIITAEKFHYADKLKVDEVFLIAAKKKMAEGDPPYLDQANICPPEYAINDPKCDYDVYYECP